MLRKHNGVHFMTYTFPTYGRNTVQKQFTKKKWKNISMWYDMLSTILILL
jgi:hypothetical protein